MTAVGLPVGAGDFFPDQFVDGFIVGNSQKRFGHGHESDPFLRGKAVLSHEGFQKGDALLFPQGSDKPRGVSAYDLTLCGVQGCVAQQGVNQRSLGSQPGPANSLSQ